MCQYGNNKSRSSSRSNKTACQFYACMQSAASLIIYIFIVYTQTRAVTLSAHHELTNINTFNILPTSAWYLFLLQAHSRVVCYVYLPTLPSVSHSLKNISHGTRAQVRYSFTHCIAPRVYLLINRIAIAHIINFHSVALYNILDLIVDCVCTEEQYDATQRL